MKDNILDKLKALLSKTVENGATEEEAASASSIAQRLITKYRLDIADVGETSVEDILEHDKPLYEGQRVVYWKSNLAYWICQYNGCRLFYRNNNGTISLSIVGRTDDIRLVRYLFESITTQIEQFARQAVVRGLGSGKRFTNSFKHGAVSKVTQRIKLAHEAAMGQAEADNRTTAIVRLGKVDKDVDEWIRHNVKVKNDKKPTKPSFDFSAYYAGREAGSKVSIKK